MRRAITTSPAAPPVLGVLAGIGLVVSVFLPWYAANIGATFSSGSNSGWDATGIAKPVLILGLMVAVSSLLLAADVRGVLPLDSGVAGALGMVLLAGSVAAGALVAYRMIVLPEPAEFLSRQIGLWTGLAAAIAGTIAGVAQLATRG